MVQFLGHPVCIISLSREHGPLPLPCGSTTAIGPSFVTDAHKYAPVFLWSVSARHVTGTEGLRPSIAACASATVEHNGHR